MSKASYGGPGSRDEMSEDKIVSILAGLTTIVIVSFTILLITVTLTIVSIRFFYFFWQLLF